MNKNKIIFLTSVLVSFTLCACNKSNDGLKRHSLTEVAEEVFKERLNKIFDNDITKRIDENDNLLINKNFSIDSVYKVNNIEKRDDAIIFKDISYCIDRFVYDKDNNVYKIKYNTNKTLFTDESTTDYKCQTIDFSKIERKDEKQYLYNLIQDDINNCKYRSDEAIEVSNDINILNSSILTETTFSSWYSPDYILLGNELYNAYDDGSELSFLKKAKSKNLNVKYLSNNENSIGVSVSGKISFKDYLEVINSYEYDRYDNYSGEVEYDLFICIENNFLTQHEEKVNYINCSRKLKNEYKGKKQNSYVESITNYYYMNFDVDYSTNEKIDVKVSDFKYIGTDLNKY